MRGTAEKLRKLAEAAAAAMMATIFVVFVLQVVIRYTARMVWLRDIFPFLDPNLYGWTEEFARLLWVWLVFWSAAFVVRESDHVRFEILHEHVSPRVRRWLIVVSGLTIGLALLASLGPTWEKFYILRLKKTATLSALFGDWIRVRHIYLIYPLFLVAVGGRYLWAVWRALRDGVEEPHERYEARLDE
ncbi:MAG: TRAP transporter small permease subunit [Alphaproteobacteria bacterium]|nr:MAG: TRAP transporter small permease subunit [Alphaproteobacteria bacterium]